MVEEHLFFSCYFLKKTSFSNEKGTNVGQEGYRGGELVSIQAE